MLQHPEIASGEQDVCHTSKYVTEDVQTPPTLRDWFSYLRIFQNASCRVAVANLLKTRANTGKPVLIIYDKGGGLHFNIQPLRRFGDELCIRNV